MEGELLLLQDQARAPIALDSITKRSLRTHTALEDTHSLPFAIMALLFLFFIGYCVAWIIYARRFHALAKYPGPFLASITRLWLVIDVARGKPGETQRRLHLIYGLNEVPIGGHYTADTRRSHRADRA